MNTIYSSSKTILLEAISIHSLPTRHFVLQFNDKHRLLSRKPLTHLSSDKYEPFIWCCP